MEVSRLAASAWTALAQGKKEEALKLMRSAADIEDKNEKHIVTPGRILPARELLGQMLLELKRPAEALKEFEASQIREPNRFHGFAGAAQAAAESGDSNKAKQNYTRLVELVGKGDPRPEVARRQGRSSRSDESRLLGVPAGQMESKELAATSNWPPSSPPSPPGTLSPCFADPFRKPIPKRRRWTLIMPPAGKPLTRKTGTPRSNRSLQPRLRSPDNADIQNYLGYGLSQSRKARPRIQTLQARYCVKPTSPRRA